MKKLSCYVYFFLIIITISCGSDDEGNLPEETGDITNTIEILTGDSQKSWRIESARITTEGKSGSFDISNESNVKDDVFIFSTAIVDNPDVSEEQLSVTWKRREAVNWNATSVEELYKDIYEKEISFGLQISEINANTFIGFSGLFDFTVTDDSVVGKIEVAEGVFFEITLKPGLESDITEISNELNLTEVGFYNIEGYGIGMTSSDKTNSLYISRRGDVDFDCSTARLEEIIQYNLLSGEFDDKSFCQTSGFFNKEPEIIDGQLVVVASNAFNKYSLDLANDPVSIDNGIGTRIFSRHKTANFDQDIFVLGATLDTGVGDELSEKLYRYNVSSEQIIEESDLPEPLFSADAEIVDNKFYLFGGSSDHVEANSRNTIHIYDINTRNWESSTLPKTVNRTFASRYQHLIYVAGNLVENNELKSFFGVFNTIDNTFTEISLDFGTADIGVIRQLTIARNKMVIVVDDIPGVSIKLFETELD
ncbi:hypothetical protein [uncultured Aquimarina sp.]|uniref:hypothetical protein n=1 Tax=uncultured Aquimarina sp. TaxID=575652 RepID=UPI002614B120|nr:hypothetical protein [uncultured Aquimarina sp.]